MSGSLGSKEIMAKNIRRHLDKRGMNVKDFATEMDFKYSTVLDWVNAKTYPRIDKIELMANYFNVEKADLIEEHDPAIKDQNIIHGDNNGLNSYNNSSVTINQSTSKENFDRSHDQQLADFELQKEILSYLEQQTDILNQLLSNTEKILDKLNKGEENGIIWKNKK